jgi:hypothetical protein
LKNGVIEGIVCSQKWTHKTLIKGDKIMNPKQHLKRSGRRKVTFYGVQIAFATDKGKGNDPDEWVNVIIYSNDNGGYVVGIGFITTIDGKWDKLIAEKVRSVQDVVQVVRENVPELADSIAEQLQTYQGKSKVIQHQIFPERQPTWTRPNQPVKMR